MMYKIANENKMKSLVNADMWSTDYFIELLIKTMIIPPWKRTHSLQTKKDRDYLLNYDS